MTAICRDAARAVQACVCGHPAAAHDAPAGPCHQCDPEHAQHRYQPKETR